MAVLVGAVSGQEQRYTAESIFYVEQLIVLGKGKSLPGGNEKIHSEFNASKSNPSSF